jgi:hypothetical protein
MRADEPRKAPGACACLVTTPDDGIRDTYLSEGERVDEVRDIKPARGESVEVVHVHMRLLEGLAWRKVKVASHFGHLQETIDAAPVAARELRLERVGRHAGVRALLDVFERAQRPLALGVERTHLVACIAALALVILLVRALCVRARMCVCVCVRV